MSAALLFKSFRGWSWIFGVLSAVPVLFGLYQYRLFAQWADEQSRNGQFVCGTGIFALVSVCVVAALAFSAAGILCGGIGYWRLPRTRPRKRLVELLAVGGAFVLLIVAYIAVGIINMAH